MIAIQDIGLALEWVKKQNKEICLAAVRQNGEALKWVKKQTKEICLAAIHNDKNSLKYVRKHILKQLQYYTNSTPLENDRCPICLDAESIDSWCMLNKCNHKYHVTCIEKWILNKTDVTQKTCPTCRENIF